VHTFHLDQDSPILETRTGLEGQEMNVSLAMGMGCALVASGKKKLLLVVDSFLVLASCFSRRDTCTRYLIHTFLSFFSVLDSAASQRVLLEVRG
jgi:hypothetical protein